MLPRNFQGIVIITAFRSEILCIVVSVYNLCVHIDYTHCVNMHGAKGNKVLDNYSL